MKQYKLSICLKEKKWSGRAKNCMNKEYRSDVM